MRCFAQPIRDRIPPLVRERLRLAYADPQAVHPQEVMARLPADQAIVALARPPPILALSGDMPTQALSAELAAQIPALGGDMPTQAHSVVTLKLVPRVAMRGPEETSWTSLFASLRFRPNGLLLRGAHHLQRQLPMPPPRGKQRSRLLQHSTQRTPLPRWLHRRRRR